MERIGDGMDELMERVRASALARDTPERRAELAARAADERRATIAQRARMADVPTDATVWPFVLRDDSERTEALVATEARLAEYEAECARGVRRAFVLVFGAGFGVSKTIGVCHACVRVDRSFLVRAAYRMPNVFTDEGRELLDRMENVGLLFLDDAELWPTSDRVLKPLLRHRFNYGRPTFIAGNVTQEYVMTQMFDDAMMSRVLAQSDGGRPWFLPQSTEPSEKRGDLTGPSMRHPLSAK